MPIDVDAFIAENGDDLEYAYDKAIRLTVFAMALGDEEGARLYHGLAVALLLCGQCKSINQEIIQ